MNKNGVIALLFLFSLSSCGALKETGQFTEGYYRQQGNKVYITRPGDSIVVYGARPSHPIDTVALLRIPQMVKKEILSKYLFSQSSLDLDVITMPIKYRPAIKTFPNQLNGQINGGVFLGKRKDNFSVHETHTPLNRNKIDVNHFGFSYGIFAGFGSAIMNPSVTNNAIQIEYEGVVFTKGVAFIVALNKVTVGLALGTDALLDRNRSLWIYQEKPWLGLAVGLNLN